MTVTAVSFADRHATDYHRDHAETRAHKRRRHKLALPNWPSWSNSTQPVFNNRRAGAQHQNVVHSQFCPNPKHPITGRFTSPTTHTRDAASSSSHTSGFLHSPRNRKPLSPNPQSSAGITYCGIQASCVDVTTVRNSTQIGFEFAQRSCRRQT